MSSELAALRRFIVDHFSLEEVRTLCFDLGIDYEELGGEGRSAQTRELLEWVGRNRRLDDLLAALKRERSQLFTEDGLSTDPAYVERLYRQLPAPAALEERAGVQARATPERATPVAAGARMAPWTAGRLVAVALVVLLLAAVAFLPGLLRDSDEQPDTSQEALAAADTDTPQAAAPDALGPTPAGGVTAAVAPTPAATAAPLAVDIPGAPLTISWRGGSYKHTLLSAQVERSSPGKRLLTLQVSAWTNAGGGMNFWSDSFRLHVGNRSLAPVNELNKLVARDTTVAGEVAFEIENWIAEAILVLSFADEVEEVPLSFPEPAPAPTATTPAPSSTPVTLPEGASVTLFTPGGRIDYSVLSARVEAGSPGKRLLNLRVRVLSAEGSMNFWSDSFRLVTGGGRLAPVNDLNEVAQRDETVDGDVLFEIDEALSEATLEISAYGEAATLPLVVPPAP